VKAAPLRYHAPDTVDEVLATLVTLGDDAKVLAGGQSLVPLLALRLARPAHLVDVTRLAELGVVAADAATVTVGATVRQRVAERDASLTARCPLLGEALPCVGHPAIRNRGTVGGSLAHADPAAELPVVAVALDATLIVRSTRGVREVRARAFFDMPFTTVLAPDELLVAVRFPTPTARTGSAFLEVTRRHGDFPLVSAAAQLTVDEDNTVRSARLAFGAVGGTPKAAPDAEEALTGATAGPDTWAAAAVTAAAALDPPDDIHATGPYRRHVARVLATRVLTAAHTRARVAT
jgi:carbon-monoxide dehydrogenase medium subunit